eukprot:2319039-Alexandrium_andersonii.AAC.1
MCIRDSSLPRAGAGSPRRCRCPAGSGSKGGALADARPALACGPRGSGGDGRTQSEGQRRFQRGFSALSAL